MARKYKINVKVDNWFTLAERLYGDQRMAFKLMRDNPNTSLSEGTTIRLSDYEKGFYVSHGEAARARGEFDFQEGRPTGDYWNAYEGVGDPNYIPPVPSQPGLRPGTQRDQLTGGRQIPLPNIQGENPRGSADDYYYINQGLAESPLAPDDVYASLYNRDLPGTVDRTELPSYDPARNRRLGREAQLEQRRGITGQRFGNRPQNIQQNIGRTTRPIQREYTPGISVQDLYRPVSQTVPEISATDVLEDRGPMYGVPGSLRDAQGNMVTADTIAQERELEGRRTLATSQDATPEQQARIEREVLRNEDVVRDFIMEFQQDASYIDDEGVYRIDFTAIQDKLNNLKPEQLAILAHFGYIQPYQETSAAYSDYSGYSAYGGSGGGYGGGYGYPRYPRGGGTYSAPKRRGYMGLVSWRI